MVMKILDGFNVSWGASKNIILCFCVCLANLMDTVFMRKGLVSDNFC